MEKWWHLFSDSIEPVTVDRFNSTSVWIARQRRSRKTDWGGYFPTWEDAHADLMRRMEDKLDSARRALAYAQSRYGNAKGMKPPAPVPQEQRDGET